MASFIVYKPHERKAYYSMWEHQTTYMEQIESVNQSDNIVEYTDGSVDEKGRSGSGTYATTYGLHVSSQTLSFRITDHSSTLQTEVAAINKTLECLTNVTWSGHRYTTIIHTDSLSSIQVLQDPYMKDNIWLISDTQESITKYSSRGGHLILNYLPSHVQISGNERDDNLAKQGTRIEEVEWNIPPSISQTKKLARKNIHSKASDIYQLEGKLSKSITWHSTVILGTPKVKMEMSRIQHVAIYRLRLCYRCSWEIAKPQRMECLSCSRITYQPMLHYILECEMTHNQFGHRIEVNDLGALKEPQCR